MGRALVVVGLFAVGVALLAAREAGGAIARGRRAGRSINPRESEEDMSSEDLDLAPREDGLAVWAASLDAQIKQRELDEKEDRERRAELSASARTRTGAYIWPPETPSPSTGPPSKTAPSRALPPTAPPSTTSPSTTSQSTAPPSTTTPSTTTPSTTTPSTTTPSTTTPSPTTPSTTTPSTTTPSPTTPSPTTPSTTTPSTTTPSTTTPSTTTPSTTTPSTTTPSTTTPSPTTPSTTAPSTTTPSTTTPSTTTPSTAPPSTTLSSTVPPTAVNAASQVGRCDEVQDAAGYVRLPGTRSRYKFFAAPAPWASARARCARDGAHLAVANDEVEALALVYLMRAALFPANPTHMHVGVSDTRQEGVWRTEDGSEFNKTYFRWARNQPEINNRKQNCMQLYYDLTNVDFRCEGKLTYACEKSVYPNT